MKVLWLCNIVLPFLCKEYKIKHTQTGGWMTGMLEYIRKNSDITIGICCPIIDEFRRKDGVKEEYRYYAFPFRKEQDNEFQMEERFCEIIDDFKPEAIHIWGSEYLHTYAMLKAAGRKNMLYSSVLYLQGSVSIYAKHYFDGLDSNFKEDLGLKDEYEQFYYRGLTERKSLELCKNVIGRTQWDEAEVKQINPKVNYYHVGEILRKSFYEKMGQWKAETCKNHTIFISQASYPIKGFHYFLQALPYIVRQHSDVKVKVAGSNPMEEKNSYQKYIVQVIKKNKLESYIEFLGMLTEDEMCQQYLQAHVFVSCSVMENSPNSICEAMLLGTPVVASFVGGVPDLIAHCTSGFLYACDEPNMLAFYISKIWENQEMAINLSKNEVEQIRKLVNREQAGKKIMSIYRSMIIDNKIHNEQEGE